MTRPVTVDAGAAADPQRRLVLRIYTYAHRLPQTIGKLPGGINLPVVVGLQQFVIFFAGVLLLFQTRQWWARFGLVPDALIMLGLPAAAAWLARAAKIQGRGLVRGLFGLTGLLLASATRHSAALGRGARRAGTRTVLRARILTEDLPAGRAAPAAVTVPAATPARPVTARPAARPPGMPTGRSTPRPALIDLVTAAQAGSAAAARR